MILGTTLQNVPIIQIPLILSHEKHNTLYRLGIHNAYFVPFEQSKNAHSVLSL